MLTGFLRQDGGERGLVPGKPAAPNRVTREFFFVFTQHRTKPYYTAWDCHHDGDVVRQRERARARAKTSERTSKNVHHAAVGEGL